jgi:hypothetical protein
MKIKDIFYLNQGHQITDEEIYKDIPNHGNVPIITANNEIKGFWGKSIVSREDLPCITYPSKANSGTCFVKYSIFDANNTAVLVPKEEFKDKVFLEWFAFKLSKLFLKIATSKEGVNYLNKEIVEELDISFPDKNVQIEQYKTISKLLNIRQRIIGSLEKIYLISNSEIIIDYKKFQAKNVSANEIFTCISGNSGLTEEYIYLNTLLERDKRYGVLTGSIDTEQIQKVNLCPKPKNQSEKIAVFSGEGIHVIRKGKAGVVNYLPEGYYTLNEDAYVLTLKQGCKYDISLKWVVNTCKKIFLEYSTSSDNGTWNMTGFFKHAKFDIPDRAEQEQVVKKFDALIKYEKGLHSIIKEIDEILGKEIIY